MPSYPLDIYRHSPVAQSSVLLPTWQDPSILNFHTQISLFWEQDSNDPLYYHLTTLRHDCAPVLSFFTNTFLVSLLCTDKS